MADTVLPKLKNLSEILHTGKDATDHTNNTRYIKIPGQPKESVINIPATEGYPTEGLTVHDRMIQGMDNFVKQATYKSGDMTYKLVGEIVPNDVKRAFSKDNTEIILTIEDDNNDGFLYSGLCAATVGNGMRLKIGDNCELTADILKDHRVDKTWFFGHADGRNEDEAVIEDLLIPGNRQPVFSSKDEKPKDGSISEGEQLLRDTLKYYGRHLGVEYDYELETDPDFNPVVQKGTLAFVENYFRTLDHHVKHDANKEPALDSLKRMLPIIVEELGYGSDEVFQSNGDIGKNLVQTRTIMKAALELKEGDNLVTALANYYGLNEVKPSTNEKSRGEKLQELEKIFTKIRTLLQGAPDHDQVSQDYASAYTSAAKTKLGLDLSDAEVEGHLKKYITSSERVDAFTSEEIKAFWKEVKPSKKPDSTENNGNNPITSPTPATVSKEDTSPKPDWYNSASNYLKENSNKGARERLIATLIQQNYTEIAEYLKAHSSDSVDIKKGKILAILKASEPGRKSIGKVNMDPTAKSVIGDIFKP